VPKRLFRKTKAGLRPSLTPALSRKRERGNRSQAGEENSAQAGEGEPLAGGRGERQSRRGARYMYCSGGCTSSPVGAAPLYGTTDSTLTLPE